MPIQSENSPLLGLKFIGPKSEQEHRCTHESKSKSNENRRHFAWALFLSTVSVVSLYILRTSFPLYSNKSSFRLARSDDVASAENYDTLAEDVFSSVEENVRGSKSDDAEKPKKTQYTKVQTLSFQIYTGGAPAYITDETTGKPKRNRECHGLHSYGATEDSTDLQCYLGLEDTAADVRRRLDIMTDAVNKAYDVSTKDRSTLKIFLAPEFFFRGKDGVCFCCLPTYICIK